VGVIELLMLSELGVVVVGIAWGWRDYFRERTQIVRFCVAGCVYYFLIFYLFLRVFRKSGAVN
jgi:hypothetical protein